MNKHWVKTNLMIALAAVALLAGCAGQPSQEALLKREASTGVPADVGNLVTPAPISNSDNEVAPRVEVEELPAVQEESAVFFSLGSATLNRKEKQKLEVIAQQLVDDRNRHVLLIGYANDNGSSSYNLAVSDNRVSTVAEFLRKHGVQNGRIRTQALGSEKIASSCRSSVCRQKFRRVDLVVSNTK